jgi:hypothetical protein
MITKSISSIPTANQRETVFLTPLGRYERKKEKERERKKERGGRERLGKTVMFILILFLTSYSISSYLKVLA